jgi:hypothetical protein
VSLTEDPRFVRGIELFNECEYLDASECFEDLFFEAVRDEVEFVRVFMQFSVGIWHAQLGQWRPAVERIEEGVRAAGLVTNDRGLDLAALTAAMAAAATAIRNGRTPVWPRVANRV